MRKKLIKKVQAVAIAACVALSAFDMTAFATTTDVTQAQETSTDTTGTLVTTETTEDTARTTDDIGTTDIQQTEDTIQTTDTDVIADTTNSNETIDTTNIDSNQEEITQRSMGYNEIENFEVSSRYDGSFIPSEQVTLDAKYDPRGTAAVTPVRNQDPWGTCWAFSAIGMAEANIVKKGLANNTLDLSELQLAYFFYHTVADPLGNTTGDSTSPLGDTYLDRGGNSLFTTFGLASWTGAASESDVPYASVITASDTLNNSYAFDDEYHMQNAYWINMTDRNDVKTMIMNYGAVSASYYHDDAYYNSADYAYYRSGSYSSNHAITIVGWDDNFDKGKFNTAPTANGAWLVKNSWGTSWGDAGYFWISYEDASFNSSGNSKVCVFDFESADNYDNNYQYDGASGLCYDTVYNGGSIANVFTATGNSTGGAELLEAVSFALYDVNVDYSIQIYKNLNNGQDPTSGTPLLSTPKTGKTSYVGYYTVPLDEEIPLEEGTTFSVVISLSSSDGNTDYFCDTTYQNGSWITFVNNSQAGQSFVKTSTGYSWDDLNNYNYTARIKAFTSDITLVQPASVSLNANVATLTTGNTTTLSATIAPTNASDKTVTWTTSNGSVATVDSNGLVTAGGAGSATITATTVNGLTATCQVNVQALEVLPASIALNVPSVTMNTSESTTLTATVSPDNATNKSVTWNTSNGNVATVDANGFVTITGIGTATITATTANGLTVSCQVTGTIGQVKSLTAQSQTTKAITLTWTKQNGVSGYEIYRYNTSKKYVKIGTTNSADSNTFNNKSLSAATTYKYKVRSYATVNGQKVYGDYSQILNTSTATAAPSLGASAASKSAKLSWGKVTGASGYEIYMSTSKSGDYTLVKTISKGSTVSYTQKNLTKKQTYYFKIRAYKTVEGVKIYSGYSKIKSIKAK